MAKSPITKKYSLSAEGILEINEQGVFIENADTGVLVDLKTLLCDFTDKTIKLSVNYSEDIDDTDM